MVFIQVKKIIFVLFIISLGVIFSGCAVYTVADTAVSVTATAVKTTAKVTGAVVEAGVDALSRDEDEKKREKKIKRATNPIYYY